MVAALPAEVPWSESFQPEGDPHNEPQSEVRDTLRRHFSRSGRGVYIASNLAVYYPNQPRIAPDVIVVMDVDPHPRESWVVLAEGKGLDLAIEILVHGSRTKDLRDNVKKYAGLGIPEYFVYEPLAGSLRGWHLTEGRAEYVPILPQGGRYPSAVLGLQLSVIAGHLRFLLGEAVLPTTAEIAERLDRMLEQAVERAEAEAQRAEAEAQRAEAAERSLAEALARLRQLEGGLKD